MAEYGGIGSWLLCSLVAALFATEGVVEEVDHIWKRPWLGYCLLGFGYATFFWFRFHPTPSGHAITAMAVVAGVMGLRPEMGGRERTLWFVLLILFAVVEIRAVNHDRKEQDVKFEEIATGLKLSIKQGTEAIEGLKTTIQEGRDHFDATMSGLGDAINTETGGNSFCYFDFYQALNDVGGVNVVRVGKYPLHGLSAEIIDRMKTGLAMQTLFKKNNNPTPDELEAVQRGAVVTWSIPDFVPQSKYLGGYQMTKGNMQGFDIIFRAFNGSWIERMEIRTVNGKLTKAIMVEAPGLRKSKFFKIDPDYPRVNGHVDVPFWPRPTKGKPPWEN